jgi:hypothetical protein
MAQVDGSASKFDLSHAGDEFSVHDVRVEIYDMRKFTGINTNDPRKITAGMVAVDRNVFSPRTKAGVLNKTHPADCYGYWAAMSYQRNQDVVSLISARLVDGKWESMTRVLTMDANPRELKRVSTPGWLQSFSQAAVTIKEPGSFRFTAPTVSCPTKAG